MRSEQRVLVKDKTGTKVMMWVHQTGRNEAWDCEVLAYAAYLYTIQGRHAETLLRQREAIYSIQQQGDLLTQPATQPPAQPTAVQTSALPAPPPQAPAEITAAPLGTPPESTENTREAAAEALADVDQALATARFQAMLRARRATRHA